MVLLVKPLVSTIFMQNVFACTSKLCYFFSLKEILVANLTLSVRKIGATVSEHTAVAIDIQLFLFLLTPQSPILSLFVKEEFIAYEMWKNEVEQSDYGQVSQNHKNDGQHVEDREFVEALINHLWLRVTERLHVNGPANVKEIHCNDAALDQFGVESHNLDSNSLLAERVYLNHWQVPSRDCVKNHVSHYEIEGSQHVHEEK